MIHTVQLAQSLRYASQTAEVMSKRNTKFLWLILYGTWVALVILLLGGCKAGQEAASPEQQARLQALVESRDFTFEADFAFPQTSSAYVSAANTTLARAGGNSLSRISLQGEGYFLKLTGDSVESHLPYYGVRDNFSEPGRPDGIELDAPVEDFRVTQGKSDAYRIRFYARRKTERFQVNLDLFPGGKAHLLISSGQRDAIRFEGRALLPSEMK